MTHPGWIDELFATIDQMDAAAFVSFLADDAVFRYGSSPALEGKEAIREGVAGFFTTIKGLRHVLDGVWVHPNAVFARGSVQYTRPDDTTVTLPFCNCFVMDGEKVKEYLVYVDPTPLTQ